MIARFVPIGCLILLLTGCSEAERPVAQNAETTPTEGLREVRDQTSNANACALLTPQELESVQGERMQGTSANFQKAGNMAVSECRFAGATPENAVVITVTKASPGQEDELQKQWQDAFALSVRGPGNPTEGDQTTTREIYGLGERAYWMGNAGGGDLYVLRGNQHIRIRLGGRGEANEQITKAEELAELILMRM